MRLRGPLVTLALLAAPALVLVPIAAAWGDAAPDTRPSPASDAGVRHDPDNRTSLAEWMDRCIKGNAKYLAHDISGAIDRYRQAILLAPKRPLSPLSPCRSAARHRKSTGGRGRVERRGAASDDRDPDVRGKILFVLADLKEREKKWDDAKVAWKAYADYAAKHVDAGMTPATPPARIQAIDDMLKQDKAYDVVRQRIAEDAKDASLPKK